MPAHPPYGEKELLFRIKEGDERAFDQLFNEWYARLALFARRYAISAAEAEEVVSESFMKFWLQRDGFDALPGIRSFLYITTRNAALNVLRKNNRLPTTPLDALETPVEEDPFFELEAIRAEVLGAVFREIENLPGKCRQVVLLTYRDGLNTAQIAALMGISVSNVTSQRARAISLLRIALADHYPAIYLIWLPALLERLLSGA